MAVALCSVPWFGLGALSRSQNQTPSQPLSSDSADGLHRLMHVTGLCGHALQGKPVSVVSVLGFRVTRVRSQH